MCCAGGKVKLPDLRSPPESLLTLVSEMVTSSKYQKRIVHMMHYNISSYFGKERMDIILILMRNPTTNGDINKKVSAMNYYVYRTMIHENADNHVLKCWQLLHQYIVDMYAKIESERLLYIRLNQVKLRSEEYIHLRDAVVNDGNLSALGKMVILPSTFTGSPRHVHEYAQDAVTYVRAYGGPDFFITFTCNPAWDEIKELLLTGQSPSDRHDISARVFKQELKSLIDFIVKHHMYLERRAVGCIALNGKKEVCHMRIF
ncbi:helitron_like_N domain-containing protein [Trichonephila clavipes]|nr:helitron_like_N domain-containing protein [Trichonephila clavipes]